MINRSPYTDRDETIFFHETPIVMYPELERACKSAGVRSALTTLLNNQHANCVGYTINSVLGKVSEL